MVRATFALDEATLAEIRRTAEKLGKPQSHIVREAVAEYAARADRLTERERLRLLDAIDQIQRARPTRSARAVDAELKDIRAARQSRGGSICRRRAEIHGVDERRRVR